jgi:hypothetical protein
MRRTRQVNPHKGLGSNYEAAVNDLVKSLEGVHRRNRYAVLATVAGRHLMESAQLSGLFTRKFGKDIFDA